MINESALRDALLALATQGKTNYVMLSSILNEVVALRETVRGLDPTFGDVLRQKREESALEQIEIVKASIAGYDSIIQRLASGHVC